MDPTQPTDPIPVSNSIGDEPLSAVKWLAALPELWPWIVVGIFCGGGVMLMIAGAIIGSMDANAAKGSSQPIAFIGGVLFAIAVIAVFLARRFYLQYEDKKRKRIRAEKHDEMMEVLDRDRKQWVNGISEEDRKWSANPFGYLSISASKCIINFASREVTLCVAVKNTYAKPRRVFVSANLAISQDGVSGVVFTIPLPIATLDALPNATTEETPGWTPMMTGAQAAEADIIRRRAGQLRVQLVGVCLTTLANLTSDPRAVSKPILASSTIPVERVIYE